MKHFCLNFLSLEDTESLIRFFWNGLSIPNFKEKLKNNSQIWIFDDFDENGKLVIKQRFKLLKDDKFINSTMNIIFYHNRFVVRYSARN